MLRCLPRVPLRAILLCVLLAAAAVTPPAALAQSSGDEQYRDPFGARPPASERPRSEPSPPAVAAPAPQPAAPRSGDEAVAGSRSAAAGDSAGELARTGAPVGLLAGIGLMLLAAGLLLRRRLT